MDVTDVMLQAAVRKAVEVKLLPKAGFIDVIEENWQKIKAVVEAALAEADDGRGATVTEPPEDDGPYCHECGNDDRKRLACVDSYANGTRWRCEVCGHEFHTGPREPEERRPS